MSFDPERREPRGVVYLALFVVAILAGSALFVSGFALGRLQGVTGGTGESRQELFRSFWEVYDDVTSRYVGQVDERRLVEGAIRGLFEALGDPYSGYMSPDEYRTTLSGISGEFEGIGAQMSTVDPAGEVCTEVGPECRLTVVHVLRESPAKRVGLRAEDVVVAVDGESVEGETLETIIPRIRGPRGTVVTLTVERNGDPLELEIERDVIREENVTSRVLADGEVGYLRVESFSSSAADDLKLLLRELLEDKGVRKLILDVRDDPGGFVDAARAIASQFLAEGAVFYEESAGGERIPQEVQPGGLATDPSIELLVLVNGGTASASEIVAGALQDTGRARLVGESTFGKGTIQEWKELSDGGGFRLSTKKWLTPKGRWINGSGLQPDVPVSVPEAPTDGSDPVLERALELLAAGDTGRVLRAAA